jgi:riboflavin biosynthesis pyrimidine reductase
MLLGAGRSALEGGTVTTLSGRHRAQLREVTRIGPDIRLRYAVLAQPSGPPGPPDR